MSFTFVTALYQISREKYDNRSYKEYQEWFKRTLTIPVPMVIYTELANKDIIESVRVGLDTKVIYTSVENVPFYHTKDKIRDIITKSDFKNRILHPTTLENRCFEYIPVVNSKFAWMKDAIENNYFNTDMFFWIDAGLSRFFQFDIGDGCFNSDLIQRINQENRVYIQIGKKYEFDCMMNNKMSLDEAIGKNINFMMAGFWGANKDILLEICKKGCDMYIEEYIKKERADNEQVLFGFILKEYASNLLLVNPQYTNYVNYFIFCNRM
jgi:hypothetical protein